MSIQSEIDRIKGNVQDTINTIQSTGVTVPPGANSDNLPGLAAALANEKQDKLTGQQGQVVGFDAEGNAVAQSPASSGVTSFEGRTGAVTAQQGDYTAAMVGAVPTNRTVNGKALSADVEIGAGDVSYDNSETSAIITGDNVQSAIDQLFTSVSDGKSLVAAAITDKGVATAATDSFAQMATNIEAIETGGQIETVTGKMIMVTFVAALTIVWSDGENGHFETVESSHDDITVMKGSVLFLNEFSSISGGVSEVKLTGGTQIGGDRVYLVTGDFTLKY